MTSSHNSVSPLPMLPNAQSFDSNSESRLESVGNVSPKTIAATKQPQELGYQPNAAARIAGSHLCAA
jgi:hypothetical protein